jgi:hypothetical protein
MGFAPVKPHGFPTFLHGKTTVFPTPFPKFITPFYGYSLQRETKLQKSMSSLVGRDKKLIIYNL